MQKNLLLFIVVALCRFSNAQTTFWTEDFGTGCNQLQLANGLNPDGNGPWVVNILGAEDPQANTWYVSAEENGNAIGACGTGCGSNQTLHVASIPNGSGFSLCASGDCGASYDAGGTSSFGGTSTGTDKRAESPIINCTGHSNITLAFQYMENGDGTNDDATLWYFDGTTWSQIDPLAKTVLCGSGQGKWTAFSLVLPASADNNPNVKIGFLWVNNDDGVGTDPSFAVDNVTLTDAVTSIPVVSITPAPSATVCQTSTLTLNGSATNSPTSYSWTVSPSAGVTFIPNATTATVSVTFTTSGLYTFTLSATNASGTGTSTQTISVLSTVTPSVSIVASPTGTLCPNTTVTVTATASNGGATPIFQWDLNGVNAGTNSATYTVIPNNGDQVFVTLTSNATCASPTTAVSNTVTMNVAAAVTPSVSIVASPTGTLCPGTTVTITATPINGGTTPAFQWNLNGANAGTNSITYTVIPNNGDQVFVTLTSNAMCASPTIAVSNTITMNVGAVVPSVSITASPTGTLCPNTTVTITATPTNGGITPAFQWSLNGVNAGTNSATYTVIPNNGDQVFVTLTSNASCASPSTAVSNTVTMNVGTIVPSVSITASPTGTVCPNTVVTFTAAPTNGGATPAFQWHLNGANAGTNSATYTVIPTNGNQIFVTLTSNASCVSPTTAVSNTITVSVTASVTPSVSITASPTGTVCPNTVVTFTAAVTNGGSTPTFQWNLDGSNTGTNSNTYTVIPVNGDQVFVTLTSNAMCVSPTTVISNTVTMSVNSGSLTVGGIKTICETDSTTLSSNGTNWMWMPTSGLSCSNCASPHASPSVTTIYTVMATNSSSCTVTATEIVIVNPSAIASFTNTSTTQGVPQTINFTNTSINANGYIWDFGDSSGTVVQTDPVHTYSASGAYTVTLIAFSANACNDTITSTLSIMDTTGLSMPNIFTPNGDGINDVFAPNAHNMKTLSCLIYDRWGSKIATLDNTNQQYWDGHTSAGLACTAGTYFYIATGTDANGKSYNLKGFIELIR